MQAAKTARATKKGAVSRLLSRADRQMNGNDVQGARETSVSLPQVFDEFEESHTTYLELASTEKEIEDAEVYFREASEECSRIIARIHNYLNPKPEPAVAQHNEGTADATSTLLQSLQLPPVQIATFDGTPRRFTPFMSAFEQTVMAVVNDGQRRLTQLLQHTSGEAYRAIEGCSVLGGQEGFEHAMERLRRQFGSPHVITQSVLADIRALKDVRTAADIRRLADELTTAAMTLTKIGTFSEVDTQGVILDICQRLHPSLRFRWRDSATEALSTAGRYPDFNAFVAFIEKQSRVQNDPVYGGNALISGADKQPTNPAPRRRTSSFITEANNRNVCICCNKNHRLYMCRLFKCKSIIDRTKFVTEHRLCRVCFLSSHGTDECPSPYRCPINQCNERHSTLIHPIQVLNPNPGNGGRRVSFTIDNGLNVLMPVVTVVVNNSFKALALLDTGSSGTFCTKRLCERLNIRGRRQEFTLNTLNNTRQAQSQAVPLRISCIDGSNVLNMKEVLVIDSIPITKPRCDASTYPHLEGLTYPEGDTVDILIGQDNPMALKPIEVKSGGDHEPFAVRTSLGWSLNGPVTVNPIGKRVVSHFITTDNIERKLDRLWELEDIDEIHDMSNEDKKVIKLWDDASRFTDGHLELPIPWRAPDVKLPDNLYIASNRLKGLLKSLKTRKLLQLYDHEIKKLISSDYAEKIPDDQLELPDRRWYLPHQAVTKKPEKIRVVFDCASQCNGISLNKTCLRGPNLTSKLYDVLLGFRQHPYAVMADIQAMYNQIKIPVPDRNALRFLWVDDDNRVEHYRMTSHLFGGVWCASSASYALLRAAEMSGDKDVTRIVSSHFYVDDMLYSTSQPVTARSELRRVGKALSEAGFHLRKYVATHPHLLDDIPEEFKSRPQGQMILCHSDKALGIGWCIQTDSFHIKSNLKPVTSKAEMLSSLASVFDPIGFISPLLIKGKLLFQQVSKEKIPWDGRIPENISLQWNRWTDSLRNLHQFLIPRCIIPLGHEDSHYELHCFSDASQRAYGACIYLRSINKIGQITTALVCSKSRVCPIKQTTTIPRLELQAAVLSAQLEQSVRSVLSVELSRSYFWSDSEIALAYIKNDSRGFHLFVSNRVNTIRRTSRPEQWHHIPGNLNPSDMISRGTNMASFNTQLWIEGPAMLRQPKHQWPLSSVEIQQVLRNDPEVKSDKPICMNVVVATHPIDTLSSYFSEWTKLKRAVAWLLKVKICLRTKKRVVIQLSAGDISTAELVIIRHVQETTYKDEIEKLTSGGTLKKTSSLRGLDPQVDADGILTVGGRLKFAHLHDSHKHPIILPREHSVSSLIVRDIHQRCHLGREWILSILRRRFWITRARLLIYQISNDCTTCRRLFSTVNEQKMADLPEVRINFGKIPFQNVAVDCCGPFMVKRGRSDLKRYGCVFTCLNIRAIHVELLQDLECDTFINALRRFIARRGQPINMYSDNGTNFVAANNELTRAFQKRDKETVVKYCTNKNISWNFFPPTASHMNGACERMIRTLKKVLKGLLTDKCRLTDDILTTLFVEAEGVINGRPLTKMSCSVQDDRPLTPNDLLNIRSAPLLSPGQFTAGDMYRRRWRYTQHLADVFWKRYVNEYLPDLQKRQKWLKIWPNVKRGDLVLIMYENTPRRLWPLGLVIAVNNGRDGLVRSVRIKTASTELVRPISKVVSLEA